MMMMMMMMMMIILMMMIDMIESPQMLHDAMAFLEDPQGRPYRGVGWYRVKIDLPQLPRDPAQYLCFLGRCQSHGLASDLAQS